MKKQAGKKNLMPPMGKPMDKKPMPPAKKGKAVGKPKKGIMGR